MPQATWCNLCSDIPWPPELTLVTFDVPGLQLLALHAHRLLKGWSNVQFRHLSRCNHWVQQLPASNATASGTKPRTVLRATWRYWAEAASTHTMIPFNPGLIVAKFAYFWNTGQCSANRLECTKWSLGWVKLTEQFWCVLHMLWDSDLRWSSLFHTLWRWFLQTACHEACKTVESYHQRDHGFILP